MTNSLASAIRDVPDFPKPGILFKDITTLLKQPAALKLSVDALVEHFRGMYVQVVAGIESRGFPFGCAVAYQLGAGFIPVRKPGKLPAATFREEYSLEYGKDALEIHYDALHAGDRVLIIDDLLATGGTASATCKLINKAGGVIVGCGFVVELPFLGGRSKLTDVPVHSLVQYDAAE
jgi:adenine phosphoribosyltransferase